MKVLGLMHLAGGWGGAERHFEILYRALPCFGVEFQLAVFSDDRDLARRYVAYLHSQGLVAANWSPMTLRNLWHAIQAARPDLLHWNFASPYSFSAGSWLLLRPRKPSVITEHLPMLRAGARWEAIRRAANLGVRELIVSSEDSERSARQHWPRTPPISIVPNACMMDGYSIRSVVKPPQPIKLLFLGRLEDQKDPLFILDVLSALIRCGVPSQLNVVGTGSLHNAFVGRIAELGVKDAVRLSGYIAEPHRALLDADLLVSASRYEGSPFAVIEALCTGLPVVASDIGPHREIASATSGVCLATLSDLDDWVAKVKEAVANLSELSGRALSAKEIYSPERMARHTAEVYKRALAA